MRLQTIKLTISVFLIIVLVTTLNTKSYSENFYKINSNIKSIKDVDENLEVGDYIILDEHTPFSSIEDKTEVNIEDKTEVNNQIYKNSNIKDIEKLSPSYILTNSLGIVFIILGVNYLTNSN